MSTPGQHDDSSSDEHNSELDDLDVTIQLMHCLQSEGTVAGVAFRGSRSGDTSPEFMSSLAIPTSFVGDQLGIVDVAFGAAASTAAAINFQTEIEASRAAIFNIQTQLEALGGEGGERRRPRLPPVRPPRPPAEIPTWEEIFGGRHEVIERERRAAEIASPRHLDTEPDPTTWPTNWDTHHDYFLWSCRGSVEVITDHLQAVFAFDPPIEETFVAARLGGVNAYKQLTFLRKYLPGETHSMQLAEARCVLYEANISNPDVRWGTQKLDVKQSNPGDFEYIDPALPCWAPPNWDRADDAFAAMYIGDHPSVFQREYGWVFSDTPGLEFIRIRMAQIPHLNLSWGELNVAKLHRQVLVNRFPGSYPDDVPAPLPAFI
ncbi:hypothetical protein BJX66DRAFT_336593 [Aspergillus keveii]|uniref:Uncharacterized protein n=1 Tax=Aspergillus keveii TaxID=714993 RepID=A0ABR4GA65_9EURO